MTNHVRKTATPVKATLCRQLKNHQFEDTLNKNVRVCTRSGCGEVHILFGGHWRYGTRLTTKRDFMKQAEKAGILALEMREVTLWENTVEK